MILVIDNYDSFTFNIIQMLAPLTDEEIRVVRNDELTCAEVAALCPTRIILSPGPGAPKDAGICEEVVREFAGKVPLLGVCLGHQAICEAFGATITRAKNLCHADVQEIALDGKGLFRTLGKSSKFTRYHSLVAARESLPACLEVTATSPDGEVMGVRHKEWCVEGVQFHPESFESAGGERLLRAFLNYRRENLAHARLLNELIAGRDIGEAAAYDFMANLTDGTMDERVMAGVLVALAAKGVSAGELVGFARAILARKTAFDAGAGAGANSSGDVAGAAGATSAAGAKSNLLQNCDAAGANSPSQTNSKRGAFSPAPPIQRGNPLAPNSNLPQNSGADLNNVSSANGRDACPRTKSSATNSNLGENSAQNSAAPAATQNSAAPTHAYAATDIAATDIATHAAASGIAEIVGTGGDGKGSFNISSLSALTAAALGVKVAKHGNRAVSSRSGAADFFEALGVEIFAAPERSAKLLARTNFAFLMAPVYHSAMRFAAPVRAALGVKTVMNLLGPLLNPAGATTALLGVYDPALLETYARAARALGVRRALVVASRDGYDEISPCAPTDAFLLAEVGGANVSAGENVAASVPNSNLGEICGENGAAQDGENTAQSSEICAKNTAEISARFVIDPRDFGFENIDENELLGGNGAQNAALALALLRGKCQNRAVFAAVALNAGALLWLYGRAVSLKDGVQSAKNALASGAVLTKINEILAAQKDISREFS